MRITADHKLFMVEFGEPDAGRGCISMGGKSVFVIALDYNEAAEKALFYVSNIDAPRKILDSDNSLTIRPDSEKGIKSIKIVTEEIIY